MSAPRRFRRRFGVRPWIDLEAERAIVFDGHGGTSSGETPTRGKRVLVRDFTGVIVRVGRDGRVKVRWDPLTG